MSAILDMRRQRLCARIRALGPRVFFELIAEIERHGTADLDKRLERYRKLDPAVLRYLGADEFPTRPIRKVAS